MKRIFKLPKFNKWMRQTGISDKELRFAVEEMSNGLIDADLGKGILKKRIPLDSRGKSGGARTIIATNKKSRWVFLLGFKKNERDNISETEKEALQEVASLFLHSSDSELDYAISRNELMEVKPYE